MDEQWRMAFMFDAPQADVEALESALLRRAGDIRRLAGGARVRIGVVDRSPSLEPMRRMLHETRHWRSVDGAVELTLASSRVGELADISGALRDVLGALAAPGSTEVMAGPMYPMVPVQDGETFLSLAFQRYPGTTPAEFRAWWRHQHSRVAIPVLGPALLAYDQVHVDPETSAAAALAHGVAPVAYDAYDNLTWAEPETYLASISDPEGMAAIAADEVGRIDDSTRRHAIMRRIG